MMVPALKFEGKDRRLTQSAKPAPWKPSKAAGANKSSSGSPQPTSSSEIP